MTAADTIMGAELLAAWEAVALPVNSPAVKVAAVSISIGSKPDTHHGALIVGNPAKERLALTLLLRSLMDLPAGSSHSMVSTGATPHNDEGHMLGLALLSLVPAGHRFVLAYHCTECTDEGRAQQALRLYVHDELAALGGPISLEDL